MDANSQAPSGSSTRPPSASSRRIVYRSDRGCRRCGMIDADTDARRIPIGEGRPRQRVEEPGEADDAAVVGHLAEVDALHDDVAVGVVQRQPNRKQPSCSSTPLVMTMRWPRDCSWNPAMWATSASRPAARPTGPGTRRPRARATSSSRRRSASSAAHASQLCIATSSARCIAALSGRPGLRPPPLMATGGRSSIMACWWCQSRFIPGCRRPAPGMWRGAASSPSRWQTARTTPRANR